MSVFARVRIQSANAEPRLGDTEAVAQIAHHNADDLPQSHGGNVRRHFRQRQMRGSQADTHIAAD